MATLAVSHRKSKTNYIRGLIIHRARGRGKIAKSFAKHFAAILQFQS
jgi:hypothetical protein